MTDAPVTKHKDLSERALGALPADEVAAHVDQYRFTRLEKRPGILWLHATGVR